MYHKKRFKMSRRSSRKSFSKGAKYHKRNVSGSPMRGGIRL